MSFNLTSSRITSDIAAEFLGFDQPVRDETPTKETSTWAETLDALLATPEPNTVTKREVPAHPTPRGINDATLFSAFSDRSVDIPDISFYGVEQENNAVSVDPVESSSTPASAPPVLSVPSLEPRPLASPPRRKRSMAMGTSGLRATEIDKHQLRRIKNRESVEKCRQKRRAVMEQVEASVKQLSAENGNLQKVAEDLSQYISEMRALLATNGVTCDSLTSI